MISSDKGKEEMGGLVYASALNSLDLAHLVHNGCDKGLECVQIGVRRQDRKTLVKLRPGLRKATFISTFWRTPAQILRDSSASCFGILSRSRWSVVAMPLKNRLSLALG